MSNDDLNPVAKVLLGVVSAKFGPGAIGRIGTIAISALVVLALMATIFAFINIYFAGTIVLITAALAFYFLERSFRYAEAHPELAAMDGAQISRVLTQQASMRQLEGLPPPPPHVEVTTQNPLVEMQGEDS